MMLPFVLQSPNQLLKSISSKARAYRLGQNMSQRELATRSGISVRTLQTFERTGRISFKGFIDIAFVLDQQNALEDLFPDLPAYETFFDARPAKRQRAGKSPKKALRENA